MTSGSIVRCVLLVGAMAFSFPFATTASHVRGGQEVGNCTTRTTNPGGACVAEPGQNCTGDKTVCVGCGIGQEVLTALCTDDTAACGGTGCAPNQKNSKLSGTSCIENICK